MTSTIAILGFAAGVVWLVLASLHWRLALWLVLLWIPVQGWFQLNVFNDSNLTVLIYEVMLLGIYLIFGLQALKSPERLAPPRAVRMAVPFAIWTLLLVPYSVSETGLLLTLVGLRTFLLTLPLIWIGYHAFETRNQLETVTALLALQFVLIGAVTVSQFVGFTSMRGTIFELPTGYTATYQVVRSPGTFSQPGLLGHYALFGIPFAIGLVGLRTVFWKRACYVVGLAGITVALIANTQRAPVVLLAVTVPLIMVLVRRERTLMIAVVAASVMVAAGGLVRGVTLDSFWLRMDSISYDLSNTVVRDPTFHVRDALQNPVMGSGLGIASPGVGRLESGPSLRPTQRLDSIKFGESLVASLLYETGLPGLVLFSLFVGAVMHQSLIALRACRGTDMELLASAIFAAQVAFLLYSWSYGPLKLVPMRVLFWFWAGVLFRLPQLAVARAAVGPAIAAARPTRGMAPVAAPRRLARPSLVATRRRVG